MPSVQVCQETVDITAHEAVDVLGGPRHAGEPTKFQPTASSA
ncbi:MAG TPA: hypothetical protein VGA66_00190 [Mycobacterium sp.]